MPLSDDKTLDKGLILRAPVLQQSRLIQTITDIEDITLYTS